MNSLLDRLKRLFASYPEQLASEETRPESGGIKMPAIEIDSEVRLDDSTLVRLMHLVEQTKEGEYSCQETLDLLDEYVDLAVGEQDAQAIMPLVKGHLDHCVDCTERYEALIRILEDS